MFGKRLFYHYHFCQSQDQNFKKLRDGFVDERAMITTKLISSCHWKTSVPFYF